MERTAFDALMDALAWYLPGDGDHDGDPSDRWMRRSLEMAPEWRRETEIGRDAAAMVADLIASGEDLLAWSAAVYLPAVADEIERERDAEAEAREWERFTREHAPGRV